MQKYTKFSTLTLMLLVLVVASEDSYAEDLIINTELKKINDNFLNGAFLYAGHSPNDK